MRNVNSALYVISESVSSLLRSNITESVACWYLVVRMASVSHLTQSSKLKDVLTDTFSYVKYILKSYIPA